MQAAYPSAPPRAFSPANGVFQGDERIRTAVTGVTPDLNIRGSA